MLLLLCFIFWEMRILTDYHCPFHSWDQLLKDKAEAQERRRLEAEKAAEQRKEAEKARDVDAETASSKVGLAWGSCPPSNLPLK